MHVWLCYAFRNLELLEIELRYTEYQERALLERASELREELLSAQDHLAKT